MQLYPNAGALLIAGLVKTALVNAKLRLFQASLPSVSASTTIADLEAHECDFTGYPAGGETVAAMLAPLLAPIGGASIDWPTKQFAAAAPYTVTNVVQGWWLETATGDLVACGTFPDTIPIGVEGQGFPLSGSLTFPNGG